MKAKINPKNKFTITDIQKYSDKCPDILKSFFKSLMPTEDDLEFEESRFRINISFNKPFYITPISQEKNEIKHFEKFLKILKKYGIVKNFHIRKLQINEINEILKYYSERDQKIYLELVKHGETEYWNFSALINNDTKKLETLQKFYDTHILESNIVELYSEEKQQTSICKYILKKSKKFDSSEFTLNLYSVQGNESSFYATDNSSDDSEFLSPVDAKHIKIMPTLRRLEQLGYIDITDVVYNSEVLPFFVSVKLTNKFVSNIKEDELSEASTKIKEKGIVPTPALTKWSDVFIRWINGNDVEITFRNDPAYKKLWNFKELGFYDEKRKCPNILWNILSTAALFEGKMSWANLGGISESDRHKKIDSFQKLVSLLRIKLRETFGNLKSSNKHEPIVAYSHDKEYFITLHLIPEKNKPDIEKQNDWRNLMTEKELERYDRMPKETFVRNPNDLPEENDY